jgi:hypothetical protein
MILFFYIEFEKIKSKHIFSFYLFIETTFEIDFSDWIWICKEYHTVIKIIESK